MSVQWVHWLLKMMKGGIPNRLSTTMYVFIHVY